MPPISDHSLRYTLANELHARPFPTLAAPCLAVYLAIKQPDNAVGRDRAKDVAHLVDLLHRYGAAHPQPGATHYSGKIGKHTLKWEQHTEFVTYTVFMDAPQLRDFDAAAFDVFPDDWLSEAPGECITSVLVQVEGRPAEHEILSKIDHWFVSESLACSCVLDDSAIVAGDFRIDHAGHMRFALFVAPDVSERRIGRIVQRLCEIETYKSMSMLGFARARAISAEVGAVDNRLNAITSDLRAGDDAARMLDSLLEISAEIEHMRAASAFRFGATGAYEAIVTQRIEVLREERFHGRQTFGEFMMRRYDPAMRTTRAVDKRLATLSERAMRTAQLLRTQVDVQLQNQNQKLLESMDRRADLQLRLQQTVEGLSVVAISYYAVSLAGYLLYPFGEKLSLSKGALTAAITLPVIFAVWLMVRRIRSRFH